jgi:hypothetical protein
MRRKGAKKRTRTGIVASLRARPEEQKAGSYPRNQQSTAAYIRDLELDAAVAQHNNSCAKAAVNWTDGDDFQEGPQKGRRVAIAGKAEQVRNREFGAGLRCRPGDAE